MGVNGVDDAAGSHLNGEFFSEMFAWRIREYLMLHLDIVAVYPHRAPNFRCLITADTLVTNRTLDYLSPTLFRPIA